MNRRYLHPKLTLLTAITLLHALSHSPAIAQPITAANDGTGTQVTQQGQQFNISGGTRSADGANLFQSFQRFGLDAGQIANFLSTPGTQNILGRVVGGNASVINGQLQISGGLSNLYLLNPAGIVFGANASLNVPGSFTATTANGIRLNNQWWGTAASASQMQALVGNPTGFGFNNSNSGSILNAGNLQVNSGQSITLLGGQVITTGTIAAPGGDITIAAVPGEKFVRMSQGNNLLSIELPTSDQVTLNQPIQGVSIAELLTGETSVNADVTLVNGQPSLNGTTISEQTGTTIVSGSVTSAATTGGRIQILGQRVGVLNADINASGHQQGGQVRIGGDYQGQGATPQAESTVVDGMSQIRADAIQNGNGGEVIIWADNNTRVNGQISAKGGAQSGNGGFVETSGKEYLDVSGSTVRTNAPNGESGTWLLDPTDIEVVTGGTGTFNSPGLFDPPTTGAVSQIDPGLIAGAIDAGTNVTLTTANGSGGSGDFQLTNSVNQAGASNASLTINARRFAVQNGSTINLNSTGALNFNLNAVAPEATVSTASVQAAIDMIGNTNGARSINLNNGTYAGATLNINKNLTLNGAGTTQTFLSGENARPVVNVTTGVTATISSVAIQNGQSIAATDAGGVNNAGNLTLNQSLIQQNQSGANGGGILNQATGVLTLTNSTVQNNTAGQGGGIFNSGSLSGNGAIITSNSATNGGGVFNNTGANITNLNSSNISGNNAASDGGGIFNSGTIQSQQLTFNSNTATNGAGVVNNTGATLTFDTATFSNNNATADGGAVLNRGQATLNQLNASTNQAGGSGGGIANSSNGQLTLNNAQLTGNQANLGGGLFGDAASTLQINTATVNNNTAQQGGGVLLQPTSTATINQITATQNTSQSIGGGIATFATLNLTQGTIDNNNATTNGGGIFNGGDLTLTQSTFTGNTAASSGGGIFNGNLLQAGNLTFNQNQALLGGGIFTSGIATVNQSSFTNNTATDDGGGIRVGFPSTPSRLTLTNSTFQGNTARFGGGLEASEGANVTVQNTRFIGNQATDRGGAVQNDDFAQMTIDNSTIDGSSAPNAAGGIFNYGNLTITNTTISNNQTNGAGGGIFNDIKPAVPLSSGVLNLTNVTASGNQSSDGGALQGNQGNITITSSTIANNTATNSAGGINQNGGPITVGNSIIATNTAPNGPDVAGQFTDQGNNLIGDSSASNGFTNSTLVGNSAAPIDPLLAALGDYGGNNQTQTLLPGSPALNTANTGTAPAADQRGLGRLGNADIGAVESQGFIVTSISGTPQTTQINTTFPAPLTVSVTSNSGEPVDGGQITFTPPGSGAGVTSTAVTVPIVGGQASIPVTANGEAGNYQVTATSTGVTVPGQFDLTNSLTPTVEPPLPPPVSPPTTVPPTTDAPVTPARFAQRNCDIASIGGRLARELQDWQLRVGDRAAIRRLLNEGKINAALQAIDIAQAQRQNKEAYLKPNVMPLGCPAAKLNDLAAETRPALIYTFVQAEQLDVILVSPGQTPQIKRISEANQAALQQVISSAKQGNTEAKQLLHKWLVQPFAAELREQAIETLVFSLDQDLEDVDLGSLQSGEQPLSQQYQIRQVLN